MRKFIFIAALLFMLTGALAYGAPVYTETWDFEDGTVGSGHPDWSAGTVYDTSPETSTAYPGNKRLWAGDAVEAIHTLPQETNQFIFMADLWTDTGKGSGYGDEGGFEGNGLAYYYDHETEPDNKA